MLFYFCEIFKTTFFTEPLRATTPGSSDHYLKAYQNDIIEAIIYGCSFVAKLS